MYKENSNKLINIIPDGDIIHIFINAPAKKKDNVEKALRSSLRSLSVAFTSPVITNLDYDDEQFYFVLESFEEYDAFKTFFYKDYCDFDLDKRKKENMYQ